MYRRRTVRQVLKLLVKGKRPKRRLQTKWFSHILEDTTKAGKIWHGIEKERLWEYR
jgi:hypothetical protein